MKTSNILLLTALLVLLCTLAAYNMALKAEYETANYRDPLVNHNQVITQGFDEIDVNASNLVYVKIEAGDKHEVYLQKDTEEVIHITQEGNRLKIDVAFSDDQKSIFGYRNVHHIVIRTPRVNMIRANAVHTIDGKQTISIYKPLYPEHTGVVVAGLKQDSLSLELDNGSRVILMSNQIGHLKASTGRSTGSESLLRILPNNKLQQADLDIRNRSYLVLQNIAIPQLSYTFSDSAHTEISGASLAILRK